MHVLQVMGVAIFPPAVRRSLQENDLTVLSIFVNPAQFAPHEDLSTYPRTLQHDLELLTAQSVPIPHPNSETPAHTRTPSAVFLPSVSEMYPSGISQYRDTQRGTFVEVKGYGDEMEGKSRPGFFRGVATVVTKLFNAIQVSRLIYRQVDFVHVGVHSQQTPISAKKTSNKLCSFGASPATSYSPTRHPHLYI
jgi:pantoate--beta-alanine ligase